MVVKLGKDSGHVLSVRNKRHLAYLESLIDEGINEGGYQFDASLFNGAIRINELFDRYRQAGWEIKVCRDHKGSYYEFSPGHIKRQ